MKKVTKKLLGYVLAFVICFTAISSVNVIPAQAATKVTVPSNVRCGVGMNHYSSFSVYLIAGTDTVKITSITKSKKKTSDLVIKRTSKNYSYSNPYETFSFYAKTAGTYKVKLAVYKGKIKRTERVVTVYAEGTGSIFSNVTLNGKKINTPDSEYSYYTSAKKGKVKFSLAKGCKIKEIKVSFYDQNGNLKTKKFRNGSTITFGKVGYSYTSDDDYETKNMFAWTEFHIIYTDKFAQDATMERNAYYDIYVPASKWY